MVMLVYQRVTIKKKALAVSHGLYSHHGMGILSHDTSDIRLKTPWPQNVRDPLEGFYGAISRKVAPEGLPWVLLYEVKGRAASPVTWFFRRLLVILVPPPSPPPPHLPRTLRADSKHCNLQYFCSFRIKKPHFATWWNLRKYQCFC